MTLIRQIQTNRANDFLIEMKGKIDYLHNSKRWMQKKTCPEFDPFTNVHVFFFNVFSE